MVQTLTLIGWPTLLNQLLRLHPMKRSGRKKRDTQWIGLEAHVQKIEKATGKRLVSFLVRYPLVPPDPDSFYKVTLDGLTACGALLDDRHTMCQLGPTRYEKSPTKGLVITLEDLP